MHFGDIFPLENNVYECLLVVNNIVVVNAINMTTMTGKVKISLMNNARNA